MPVINIQNLTKYYGVSRGIENVNFSVGKGEVFGFIGPNGAGKSTTIRTLLGLIYPTSGSATIFGLDILKDSKTIKKSIGYLPSDVNYYAGMTASELLRYSASFYGIKTGSYYTHLIEVFGVDVTKKFEDLSMGNKKKVGIIQALLHQPKLLILDEPTSGLDPLMQAKLFEVLKEENAKGTTVFFSSHVLSDVQKMCRRVAIIREGGIVAVENIQTLRSKHLKKCRIDLSETPHVIQFALGGINELKINNNAVEFMYAGEMRALIQHLGTLNITNLSIEEPSLEEIFMHYYN